jgi:hypothetical protein
MDAGRSKNEHRSAAGPAARWLSGVFAGALVLVVMTALLAGCGPKTGPTETIRVDEPLASAAVTDVELVMGTGRLSLSPGASGLMSGTIRCNVKDWQPEIRRNDTRLLIQQKSRDSISGSVVTTVNDWDLQLGDSPMRLTILAGAYQGELDLTGLTLQDLSIEDGAARTQVMFNAPNPGQMERLRYKTGASTVSLIGLANANFRSMEFTGGAGAYSLDFSGQVRTEATARIAVGTGSVRIQVPSGMAMVVKVSGSQTAVDTQGMWVTKGSTHSTPAAGAADGGKVLTVELEMAAGTATLVAQ